MIVGSVLLVLVAIVLLGAGLARGSNALIIASIAASLFACIALIAGIRQATGRPDDADPGDEELDTDPREVVERRPARTRAGAGAGQTTEVLAFEGRPFDGGPPRGGGFGTDEFDPRAYDDLDLGDDRFDGDRRGGDRSGGDRRVGDRAPDDTRAGASGAGVPAQGGARQVPEQSDPRQSDPRQSDLRQSDVDTRLPETDDYDDEDPPDEPAPQVVSATEAARVARMSIDVLVIDGRPRYHLAGCVHLLGRESESLPVGEAVELGFTPCSLCEPDSALLAEARRV